MKKRILPVLALCLLLTGCGNAVLERSYSVSAPHSEVYWENENADTLRADSYQDLVNALLLLLGEHSEEGAVRIYNSGEDAAAMAEQACREVQDETALGAYLLEYISYTGAQEHGFYEMQVRLGYRRTAEEQADIITATSTEALPDLLRLAAAREGGGGRIAIRFGYFTTGRDGLREMVAAAQQELAPESAEPWQVYFYPDTDDVGIVEVVLDAAAQD